MTTAEENRGVGRRVDRRSLAGDDEAFVEVVRRHATAVSAYLVRRVGPGSAEDLLGDVWVAALSARASYERSFPDARPWLFGIARNTIHTHWRSIAREELVPEVAELPALLNPWPDLEERIDAGAFQERWSTRLRQAIAGLAPEERDVLLLVAWEQLSVADAARVLGIPAGTARYRLHRARLALRASPGMVQMSTELNEIYQAERKWLDIPRGMR